MTILDNFSAGKVENIQHNSSSGNFHLIKGDVRNLEHVKKAVKDVDVLFHLAALVNVPLCTENPLLVNDVNARAPKYVPPRAGDIRHSYADISKAERIMGYEPRIMLDEGIGLVL